jgi:phage-related protein
MIAMGWHVVFYRDVKGNEPVIDFINNQSPNAKAEIFHVIDLLREFNIHLGKPYVRKIHKSGLRELRIKHGSDYYRIFYFAYTQRRFFLLHSIVKQQDKTPPGDIKLSLRRMDDVQERY